MDFNLTSEQEQLRDSLRAFLADRNDFETRTKVSRSEAGWSEELWRSFADMLGILGASVPESAGGLGCGAVDVMIIMEELGRSLVIEPYLESVIIAGSLLRGRDGDLARIAAGDARFAFAWAEASGRYRFESVATAAERCDDGWMLSGDKAVVAGAPWATDIIVTARTAGRPGDRHGLSLFLVESDAAGVFLAAYPTIDGRRAAEVRFEKVKLSDAALIGQEHCALPLVEKVGDIAIAAISAEAIGVMHRLLEDTIEYTKQRRQFGQPISSFQVLQHRMVDMYMQLELAKSAVYLATLSLDAAPIDRARAASTAKVVVGKALRFIGQNAIQLHGGIGMTDELAVGHYFKRATVIESEFGSVDYHLARYVALGKAA